MLFIPILLIFLPDNQCMVTLRKKKVWCCILDWSWRDVTQWSIWSTARELIFQCMFWLSLAELCNCVMGCPYMDHGEYQALLGPVSGVCHLHYTAGEQIAASVCVTNKSKRRLCCYLMPFKYTWPWHLLRLFTFSLRHTHSHTLSHHTSAWEKRDSFFYLEFLFPSSTAVYSATQWRYHGNAYLSSWEIGGCVYFCNLVPLSKIIIKKNKSRQACTKGHPLWRIYKNIIWMVTRQITTASIQYIITKLPI